MAGTRGALTEKRMEERNMRRRGARRGHNVRQTGGGEEKHAAELGVQPAGG